MRPHPDGDRIFVAVVDIGGGKHRTVVFGGERMLCTGDHVAVALPGARLPSGERIRPRNFRGVRSEAELLSSDELGWTTRGPDVVLRLDDALQVGTELTTPVLDLRVPAIVFLDGPDRAWDPTDAIGALQRLGYAVAVRKADDDLEEIRNTGALVWPLVYTVGGEPIFEKLDALDIVYLGPSFALASCRSKVQLQEVLRFLGLPVAEPHRFPKVVKAEYSTGSHGVVVVDNERELARARQHIVAKFQQRVVVQRWHHHREYTCAVLRTGNSFLVATLEIDTGKQRIFDEGAKRRYDGVSLHAVSPKKARELSDLIGRFWTSLGGGDYARIDVVEDYAGSLYIIDVNLLPWLDHNADVESLFPLAIERLTGMPYDAVLLSLVQSKLARTNSYLQPSST